MKKLSLLTLVIGLFALNLNAQDWSVDNSHSSIEFAVDHMVISKTKGDFGDFTLQVSGTDGTDWSKAEATAVIKVNSLSTDNERRDGHLMSDDFFSAEKYPEIKFVSQSFKKSGEKGYKITGDLTIRDVTKKVTFDAKLNGTVKDPWGNTRSGWEATTTINRMDYGLKWSQMTEAGGLVVGEEVDITMNIELIKSTGK